MRMTDVTTLASCAGSFLLIFLGQIIAWLDIHSAAITALCSIGGFFGGVIGLVCAHRLTKWAHKKRLEFEFKNFEEGKK